MENEQIELILDTILNTEKLIRNYNELLEKLVKIEIKNLFLKHISRVMWSMDYQQLVIRDYDTIEALISPFRKVFNLYIKRIVKTQLVFAISLTDEIELVINLQTGHLYKVDGAAMPFSIYIKGRHDESKISDFAQKYKICRTIQ